jgi:hypothetical protein
VSVLQSLSPDIVNASEKYLDKLTRVHGDDNRYEVYLSLYVEPENYLYMVSQIREMLLQLYDTHQPAVTHNDWAISNVMQRRREMGAKRNAPVPESFPIHIRKPTTSTSYCGCWNSTDFAELGDGGTCPRCLILSKKPIKAKVEHPMAKKKKR